MTKAFEILKDDHKKVKDIIHQLKDNCSNKNFDKQSDLLALLKEELKLHEKIEENLLYPILKYNDETKPLALEAYEEHTTVNYLLKKLEKTDFKDETWLAKLAVLEENLKHHIKEEENCLFPETAKILSKPDLEELVEEIEEMKKDK